MASGEYRLKTAAKLIGVGIVESCRPPSGRALRLERENTVTLSLQRESNFTFDQSARLEPLRQTEFREQCGVEKGHNPGHPVGPQVQHM